MQARPEEPAENYIDLGEVYELKEPQVDLTYKQKTICKQCGKRKIIKNGFYCNSCRKKVGL